MKTVEDELGRPQIQPGDTAGSTHAVYALDGCVGKVLIDTSGFVWMTNFANVPAPQTDVMDQVRGIEKRIKETKIQLEGLEALKAAYVKRAAELAPTPPDVKTQNTELLKTQDADTAYTAGNFEEAAQAYTAFLATTPANENVLLRRAYCYHRLGRLKDAVQDYSESIRLVPSPIAYRNRAILYLRLEQVQEALADLEQSVAITTAPAINTGISTSPSAVSTGGSVHVKGYTRKDGTYVAPHTRSAPRRH